MKTFRFTLAQDLQILFALRSRLTELEKRLEVALNLNYDSMHTETLDQYQTVTELILKLDRYPGTSYDIIRPITY